MQYIFTAVFTKDVDGTLQVNFPDLPGCTAQGKDMLSAMQNAESILCLCLFDMEQQGINIPQSRYPNEIKTRDGEVTSVILTDTDSYHSKFSNKMTSHTVTVPAWLGQIAETSKLDVSQIFTDAIKREIGMPIHKKLQHDDSTTIVPAKSPAPDPEGSVVANVKAEEALSPTLKPLRQPKSPKPLKPLKPLNVDKIESSSDNSSDLSNESIEIPVTKKASKDLDSKRTSSKFKAIVICLLILLVLFGAAFYIVTQTTIVQDWLFREPAIEVGTGAGTVAVLGHTDETNQNGGPITTEPTPNTEPPTTELLTTLPLTTASLTPPENSVPSAIIQSLRIHYNNNDIIGHLTVEGTYIDHAVAQGIDNNFYLAHDIRRNPSEYGWVFIDAWTELDIENNNIVLYGSNIPYGIMFNCLSKFKDFNFFAQSPVIRFTTYYGEYHFEVFSFYEDASEFNYSSANFQQWAIWINHFAAMSIHPTTVNVDANDRIITLVTNSSNSNSRYVLHARLI